MSSTTIQEAIQLEHPLAGIPSLVGSLSVRASPSQTLKPSPVAKSHGRTDDVELAVLGKGSGSLVQSRAPSLSATVSAAAPPGEIPAWKARVQFATLCCALFVVGWNDGTTGPLLPRIQSNYHVGYAVVSLIYVFNCAGFVTAAIANVRLTDKFGFGTVMVIGSLAQVIAYSLESPAPPFPVFVLGYAVNGFGVALQDASASGFVASFKDNAATKMGMLHAIYGLGAFCAPLSATQFAHLGRWSFQYLISLGLAVLVTILHIVVFRFKSQEQCLKETGQLRETGAPAHEQNQRNKYRQIFRLKEVYLLAVFILIYVGTGVTIGGWTVTYIINVRGGSSSSGYVSSGFFGGLTIGRVALLGVNKLVGERRVVFLYITLAIGLELIVWLVPSLIGGAVAVSFIGVLLGPIYPIAMNHSARILPSWLLTGCIGFIGGFGQAGSAFIPFLTGAIASSKGIATLQPLMVAMMGAMLCLWFIVPSSRRLD